MHNHKYNIYIYIQSYCRCTPPNLQKYHDDVIKWKHFPRYWSFVRGNHRSPVNSPHKGQWHGALMFSLICVWINDWVNNREAGDLRRYRTHYDVIVMHSSFFDAVQATSHYLNQWWLVYRRIYASLGLIKLIVPTKVVEQKLYNCWQHCAH